MDRNIPVLILIVVSLAACLVHVKETKLPPDGLVAQTQ